MKFVFSLIGWLSNVISILFWCHNILYVKSSNFSSKLLLQNMYEIQVFLRSPNTDKNKENFCVKLRRKMGIDSFFFHKNVSKYS